jgi:hypothetical protein
MVIVIEVADFGPIKAASFFLRPLTVFVGPNNSGKSVLATIAYAALEKRPAIPMALLRSRVRRQYPRGDSTDRQEALFPDERSDWLERVLDERVDPLSSPSIPEQIEATLRDKVADALRDYSQEFISELERCFGTKLADMRRAHDGATRTRIQITSTTPGWRLTLSVAAKRTTPRFDLPDIPALLHQYLRAVPKGERAELAAMIPEGAFELLAAGMARTCFRSFPRRSKYLPAARSGLLQSQRVLTGTLIRRASLAGIEDIQVPALSGVITDFLGEMVTLSKRDAGAFEGQAAALEERLLSGKIEVEQVAPMAAPEFLYLTPAARFPLHRTSSMVSEIAPIVLYLRHILHPYDLLIVEEPEAHLHPASQVALAEILCGLINYRLTVIITTHSEFFLQQVSNLIVASQVDADSARGAGIMPENAVPPNRVGTYIFRAAPSHSGTVVEELEVSKTTGLSEASFISVAESLYNQSIKLDRGLPE